MSVSLMTSRAPGLAPSRRGFLVGCAGLATAISLTPGGAWSTKTRHLDGDLFAFAAPDRPDVVFAIALRPQPFGQAEHDALTVRLHAGASTWTIGPHALMAAVGLSPRGARIFSGKVWQLRKDGETAAHLIALTTPAQRLPRSNLGVWAEVVSANGIRARIGNPAISYLLEEDGRLAGLRGQLEPERDRRLWPAHLPARSPSAETATSAATICLGPTASRLNSCLTCSSSILRILAASRSRRGTVASPVT